MRTLLFTLLVLGLFANPASAFTMNEKVSACTAAKPICQQIEGEVSKRDAMACAGDVQCRKDANARLVQSNLMCYELFNCCYRDAHGKKKLPGCP